jgi:hypothetical protein
VQIIPQEVSVVKASNKIAISVVRVDLFSKAIIEVQFISVDHQLVNTQVLEMTGNDYLAWGSNDQYIINWTLNKLGLTPSVQVIV